MNDTVFCEFGKDFANITQNLQYPTEANINDFVKNRILVSIMQALVRHNIAVYIAGFQFSLQKRGKSHCQAVYK